jgi:DNA-binding transcriptional regulator YiaG
MANDNQNPFYRDMKSALTENRFDKKSKQTPQEKLAALEKRLDREKLSPSEIEDIRKQMAVIQERLAMK